MATERAGAVTMRGNPLTLVGDEVKVGAPAPDFQLVGQDMSPVKLSDYQGKVVIVSCVPSLDTPVCDTETRRWDKERAALGDDVEMLTVSMDLPMAQKRWCGAAEVGHRTASSHRDEAFATSYGVLVKELRLLARTVFVVGKDGKVAYAEYVKEIASEPNYEAALEAAKAAK
ncbi:MAG: thiol peroxidase [Chloroflexota bacterium]